MYRCPVDIKLGDDVVHFINLLIFDDYTNILKEYRIVRSYFKRYDCGFVKLVHKTKYDNKQRIIGISNSNMYFWRRACYGKCTNIIKYE